jgi:Capsule assembly protein Wzi/PAP2 superfamily
VIWVAETFLSLRCHRQQEGGSQLRALRASFWAKWMLCVFAINVMIAGTSPECKAQGSAETSRMQRTEDSPVNISGWSTTEEDPQTNVPDPPARATDHENTVGFGLVKHILEDQEEIWTSPRHLSWEDADILVPFGMGLGGLLPTDSDFSRGLSNSPSRLKNSLNFSNYGIGAMIGLGGGLYVWGHLSHDDHKRETGILAGEAAVNGFLVTTGFKYAFGRDRPLDTPQYSGDFWKGGTSMPSQHAAVAWAIASVVAHEYPGPLTSVLAYGLASSIGVARITAKQHFPSDVLVGSVIGWYMGKQAYRAHHDPELGGTEWQSYGEFRDHGQNDGKTSLGTTYVPLSSWIYPALKRLIALGYIQSEFIGMQPWTRQECARMVEEAGERITVETGTSEEVDGLYSSLVKEFTTDSERLGGSRQQQTSGRVESAYARISGISGQPLNDSYHFGQTLIDDFGRPFGEGVNAIAGGSAWVTQGRFALYASGEYETAPGSPPYSAAVNQVIATMDGNPVVPGIFPSTSQFRLMDTYVSSNQMNWILSFGKQSLWWSPDYSNAFLMSDNAAPIYMFRVSRQAPFEIPGISRLLGPMKIEAFFGKLSGNQFPPRPMLHGEKFSFKPSPNLEFGFTRTGEMGGVGRPITLKSLWESYTSFTNSLYATGVNPGKRTSGFDMNYRLPGLRNWVTIYTDSIATDNITPFADLPRGGFAPGIYLTRFPKMSRLDLRVEAAYTDTPKVWTPPRQPLAAYGQYIYWDSYYHDLYTNNGFLIGSPVGREAHSYQAWTTYHVSARDWLQFGYRHTSAAPDWIPGGGNINDASVSANWWLRGGVNATALLQYEKWNYPVLSAKPQTNWTSSVGVTIYPETLRWGH